MLARHGGQGFEDPVIQYVPGADLLSIIWRRANSTSKFMVGLVAGRDPGGREG
jgi:hypothetical protein